jgi:hypothetical protein
MLLRDTLNRIREQVKSADRVVFAMHSWMPLKNIGTNGFKLPCVPAVYIPRLELLPIVAQKEVLVDSRVSTATNKFVPFNVEFNVDIENSWVDLMNKHGQYGMVRLDALECDINTAERINEVFRLLLVGFVGGKLQDLPAFYGEESPVRGEFEIFQTRIKTTARQRLAELVAQRQISKAEEYMFLNALPEMARSARIAHNVALSPTQGILPKSIEGVNTMAKPRFDATDNWIAREFPDYNVNSRLSQKQEGDAITRLAEVLAGKLGQQAPQAPVQTLQQTASQFGLEQNNIDTAQPPVAPTFSVTAEQGEAAGEPEAPFELSFSVEDDPNAVPLSLAEDVPELTLPDVNNQIETPVVLATSNNEQVDFGQCKANTVAGAQCQNQAIAAHGACMVRAHQVQVGA